MSESNHKRPSRIPDDKPERQMYQTVWITLSDGSKHGFCGKAAVFTDKTVTITDIQFTTPKELPKGMSFEKVEDAE